MLTQTLKSKLYDEKKNVISNKDQWKDLRLELKMRQGRMITWSEGGRRYWLLDPSMKKTEPVASPYHKNRSNLSKLKVRSVRHRFCTGEIPREQSPHEE